MPMPMPSPSETSEPFLSFHFSSLNSHFIITTIKKQYIRVTETSTRIQPCGYIHMIKLHQTQIIIIYYYPH